MSNASDFVIENGVLKKYVPATTATEVIIPSNVHTVGSQAFWACQDIAKVFIPESVKVIEPFAFALCTNLQEMVLPDSITRVGFAAFNRCSKLKELRLPAGLHVAKAGAFWSSDDEVVPDPRLQVERYTFGGCVSLKKIVAPGINELDTSFRPLDRWGALKLDSPAYVMPEVELSQVKNTKTKQALLLGYLDNVELYSEHETYRKLLCAQRNSMLSLFFQTDCVAAISILAEAGKITAKNFNEYWEPANKANATQIKAFLLEWENSKGISASDNALLALDEKPASISALKKIWDWEEIENGCVEIFKYKGHDASILIPSMLKNLRVTSVGLCVASVGPRDSRHRLTEERRNFLAEKLQSVELSPGIKTVAFNAFEGCENLQSIILPDTVEEIKANAFEMCTKLTILTGTSNIKHIGKSAFAYCESLSGNLYLDSVIDIEFDAFRYCGTNNLNIYLTEKATHIDKDAFLGSNHITIHAPTGSYAETYAKEHDIPFVAE